MFLFLYSDKMVKKLGLILGFVIIISISFISFLFFNQMKELGGDSMGDTQGTGQAIGERELGINEDSGGQEIQKVRGFDSGGTGGSTGGSGGTGGGGTQGSEGSDVQNTTNVEIGDNELKSEGDRPLCLLARPGNLPNIRCEVNYINADSVSLKILNDLEEDMSVNIVLNDCFTTAHGLVPNKGNSDFIFSCGIQEYFESDMTITYTIGQSNIKVIGFVKGFIF